VQVSVIFASVTPLCKKRKQTYLAEDHGGDLGRSEGLGLAEVLNLDEGLTLSTLNDLERP
jgi:hypothetical protein